MAFTAPTDDVLESGDNIRSFVANEDVIRGQVVIIGGEDLGVKPSATDGEQAIGVALQTVSSGDQVAVAMDGCEVKFTAGASGVSRGDKVTSHGSSGEEGQVNTADATGDWVVGDVYEGAGSQGDALLGSIDLQGQVN